MIKILKYSLIYEILDESMNQKADSNNSNNKNVFLGILTITKPWLSLATVHCDLNPLLGIVHNLY